MSKETKLIAFEGIDGSGKTLQAKLLQKSIPERFSILMLREPWRRIDVSNMTNMERYEFYCKDRKENLDENIRPNLGKFDFIIMDRYYYSTVAYQWTQQSDISWQRVFKEQREISVEPDLVFILDVSLDRAIDRITYRDNKSPDRRAIEDMSRAKRNYETMHFQNVIHIDANRAMDVVFDTILVHFLSKFKDRNVI